jgi:DNA-binding transcriptional ArsR family regulator
MNFFFLLGHPVRWRIVEILAAGAHTAGEIAEALYAMHQVERTVVSHHLRRLREADLIRVRRDWSNLIYRLDPRVAGTLRLAAEGLETRSEGGTYDDIALHDDVIAGHDELEFSTDDIPPCWCMHNMQKMRTW